MMVEKKSAPKSVSQGQKPLLRVRFDSERWVCVDPDAVDGASTTDSHWKRFARSRPRLHASCKDGRRCVLATDDPQCVLPSRHIGYARPDPAGPTSRFRCCFEKKAPQAPKFLQQKSLLYDFVIGFSSKICVLTKMFGEASIPSITSSIE